MQGVHRAELVTPGHNEPMKVALVAESFLPHQSGVTHTLLRVIDHLAARGDEAMVIAPEASGSEGPSRYGIAGITRLPAMAWPGYSGVRVALSGVGKMSRTLEEYEPDVVHLASPFTLGWTAVRAANELNLPCVAVYQTEIPSYADKYRFGWSEKILWNRVLNIHERADLTLVPSTFAFAQLESLGVPRLRMWPRGVDIDRFNPVRRDAALRRAWAPNGEVVIGYVGRLAPEKKVEALEMVAHIPGVSLVIVGDGPERARLESIVPAAHFTGQLGGTALADAYASFDIFVAPGELETFGQTIQEALASGVPVIAPRRGGPIDLITPEVTGFLYEPGDLEAMKAAIAKVTQDPALRSRMSHAAREWVAGRTWEAVCESLVGYYGEAISLRSHASTRGPA